MDFFDFCGSGACISISKDDVLLGWGQRKTCSFQELDSQRPAYYFPHFFLQDQKSWRQFTHWRVISHLQLLNGIQKVPLDKLSWEKENKAQFKSDFETLQKIIGKGYLQKGVPYTFKRSRVKMDANRLQYHFTSAVDSVYRNGGTLYGFWDEEEGMLGITPELLFRQDEKQKNLLHTMALAGTAPCTLSSESFLKQEKDLKEHDWVVSGIIAACTEIGNVRVSEKKIVRGPHLSHIMTPIEVTLRDSFDFMQCVRCLHPTPALGSFPKEEGKTWLLECEKQTPRKRFGAPVGILFPQISLARCFVAIRNIQWDLHGIHCGAGCGVIRESEFEKEWKEIQLKFSAILLNLGLINEDKK